MYNFYMCINSYHIQQWPFNTSGIGFIDNVHQGSLWAIGNLRHGCLSTNKQRRLGTDLSETSPVFCRNSLDFYKKFHFDKKFHFSEILGLCLNLGLLQDLHLDTVSGQLFDLFPNQVVLALEFLSHLGQLLPLGFRPVHSVAEQLGLYEVGFHLHDCLLKPLEWICQNK